MIKNKLPLNIKYRPINFSDVLDQKEIITVLKNIIKNKNYGIPFMFTGFYGGGKTTLARIFARAILCKNVTNDYEPCNICDSCISFLEESNLSYTEIDAATNSGVDKIRKIRDEANYKSLGNNDLKVVVIDECHSISNQGNEALLKQLEEMSVKQVYIFCTTSPDKMLDTVRSRCFEFNLNKISANSISKRLEDICSKELISFEKEALNIIADQDSPHVRDCLKTLDYLSNFGKITEDIVYKHYKLDLISTYLDIIFNLKDNVTASLSSLNQAFTYKNSSDIYEGIIQTIIDCQKLAYGINKFKNSYQLDFAHKILDKYGSDLNIFLENLTKRNRYFGDLVLESDLIIIHNKLTSNNYSIKKIEFIEDIDISGKQRSEDAKNDVNIENNINNNFDVFENLSEEDNKLEETSKILKRYQSYPQQLAILMDKGKKSSSIKNSAIVELKHRVKDYKRGIEKEEISNFLKTKRVVT